jgi:hypothetical protein
LSFEHAAFPQATLDGTGALPRLARMCKFWQVVKAHLEVHAFDYVTPMQ